MKRREFIKKAGKTVALAAAAGNTGLFMNGCQSGTHRKTDVVKPDFEVPVDPQWPKVTLAKNADHAEALRAALEAIGGIGRFVKEGETFTCSK